MTDPDGGGHLARALRDFAGSARFAQALTLLAVGFAFSTHAVRSLIGWPGLLAALAALLALCVLSLIARWRAVEWYGILPITILVFVGWCAASVLWSNAPGWTAVSVVYLVAFAFLGVYVALMRDTIQIVRAFGDVMRVLLGVSLALEVLSGILLDVPIAILGIQGDLAELGPIQGIFGSRNLLGFVALIALLTFVVEWRTRILPRGRAIGSLVLASLCIVLSGSPDDLDGARSVARGTRRALRTAARHSRHALAVADRAARRRRGGPRDRMDRPHPDHRAPRRARRVRRAPRRLAGALPLPQPESASGVGLGRVLAGCRSLHLDRARDRPTARLGAQRVRRRVLPGRGDRRADVHRARRRRAGAGMAPRLQPAQRGLRLAGPDARRHRRHELRRELRPRRGRLDAARGLRGEGGTRHELARRTGRSTSAGTRGGADRAAAAGRSCGGPDDGGAGGRRRAAAARRAARGRGARPARRGRICA